MYRHILVGFDESANSQKALEKAAIMVKLIGNAKLTVAKAGLPSAEQQDIAYYNAPDEHQYILEQMPDTGIYAEPPIGTRGIKRGKGTPPNEVVDEEAKFKAKDILNKHGVLGEFINMRNDPSKSLLDYAEYHEVDLIVVGHSEKSFFEKFAQKNVSDELLKHSSADLLVVQ